MNHISNDFMYQCSAPIPSCILPIVYIADIWYGGHFLSLTNRHSLLLAFTLLSVVSPDLCRVAYHGP